jgi:low affinity Fe/Cu permease
MAEQNQKSWLEWLGCRVSEWVADVAGHPFAQTSFLLFCGLWFLVGWRVDILTASLSILAITLTQMVLNRQNERELDDHRRDVAMHAKLDELVAVTKPARNDLVAVEEKEEEEIVHLKDEVKEAVETASDVGGITERVTAKRTVDVAATKLTRGARKRANGQKAPKKQAAGAK